MGALKPCHDAFRDAFLRRYCPTLDTPSISREMPPRTTPSLDRSAGMKNTHVSIETLRTDHTPHSKDVVNAEIVFEASDTRTAWLSFTRDSQPKSSERGRNCQNKRDLVNARTITTDSPYLRMCKILMTSIKIKTAQLHSAEIPPLSSSAYEDCMGSSIMGSSINYVSWLSYPFVRNDLRNTIKAIVALRRSPSEGDGPSLYLSSLQVSDNDEHKVRAYFVIIILAEQRCIAPYYSLQFRTLVSASGSMSTPALTADPLPAATPLTRCHSAVRRSSSCL